MRVALLVLCTALAPAAALAQGVPARPSPVITAAAGFDGCYTVGRWMPVRIDAENRGVDFAGEVRVEWGATRYRQAVALPSPSRKRVEFYVRAADLRDSIQVTLHDGEGRAIATHDVAVRGLLPAETLDVVPIRPADLPGSWRGYDGVDEVHVDGAALLPAQARALERWRAVHEIDEVPALRREISRAAPARTVDRDRWRFAATYVGALLVLLGVLPRLAQRPAAAHAALVAAVLLFAAVPAINGVGAPRELPPTMMRSRATGAGTFISTLTFAQPLDRATAALVTVAGREALLEAAPDAPPHEIRYDEDGDAVFAIHGTAGEVFSVIARSFGSPSND